MSKFVKDLVSRDIARRLEGVGDCVIANVIGIDSNSTTELRKQLREKDVRLMVIKNSLARRATEGTSLAPAFDGLDGNAAVMWGAEDFVSLVKIAHDLHKNQGEYEKFEARGGVMDGEKLSQEKVAEISKWPSRTEQLSMLVGQILGPGSQLSAQVKGPGSALASQVKQIADKEDE